MPDYNPDTWTRWHARKRASQARNPLRLAAPDVTALTAQAGRQAAVVLAALDMTRVLTSAMPAVRAGRGRRGRRAL